MKNILFFIVLSCNWTFGQNLKLSDLTTLCGKNTWNEVNSSISAKGWEYHDSEMGDFESYNVVNWAYESDYFDRTKAKGWLTLYTYEGLPSKINYQVFNKKSFALVESSIASSGFKLLNSEVLDDMVVAEYANEKYMLKISYSKLENEDYYDGPSTAYSIEVTKKGSVYDPDNGLKYEYNDDLNLVSEYHLKNGELHGQMIEYYPEGNKKSISNWSNGKLSGKTINYDEHGNIESEYTVSNNMLNGIRKDYMLGILVRQVNFKDDQKEGVETTYYLNGKIKSTVNYTKGKRNGTYLEYDSDGMQLTKETYINDMLNGPFEKVLYNEDELPYEIASGNYIDDNPNGKVLIRSYKNQDTLRIQHYSNGKKTGKWLEYENKKLAFEYGYKNDQLDGIFVEYFTSGENIGKVITECLYRDGVKHGTEKTYFKLFEIVDDSDQPNGAIWAPMKEIINYSYGDKNGFYSYEEFGFLREEGEYAKNLKTGNWLESETGVFWDTATILLLKGKYNFDKREGIWKGFVDNKLYVECNYKNGQLDGTWQFYRQDGTLGTRYQYKNDQRTEIHFYSENYNYQSITLLNHSKNIIDVQVENKNEKAVRKVDYQISDQVNFDDPDFVKYFNDETKATTEPDADLHNYKQGNYFFENAIYQTKGHYLKNQQTGIWSTLYKNQSVVENEEFQNGKLVSDSFSQTNGSPYSGTLNYDMGKVQVSIKIKDGLRNGPTTETLDGMEISRVKYKRGVVKE